MKKNMFLLIIFVVLSTSIFSQNNAIDNLFENYADSDDFTSVFISSKMFGTIANTSNDNELNDLISSLKGLNILTTKVNPMTFYKEAKSKLYGNGYDELILLVGKDDNAVLMSFTGNIELNKISKLGKTIHIDGAENLDKLNDQ